MFNNNWDKVLSNFMNTEEFQNFYSELMKSYKFMNIYPEKENIFRSLKLTDYNDVKIVILGQDPYHQKGQANGLAFSVNSNTKLPPSLINIFNEIRRDTGIDNISGDLTNWARQGVLLLNNVLTVKESCPNSFSKTIWSSFTDKIIHEVSKKGDIIFLLWGNNSQSKIPIIEKGNYILKTTHPSPLSAYRGFNGCGHFSEVNKILSSLGKKEIDWSTL